MGRIPTVAEYLEATAKLRLKSGEVYRYMNFDQIPSFREVAAGVL
jgi:aconitate hydratase 2/2-methylisocitrate dehydratase